MMKMMIVGYEAVGGTRIFSGSRIRVTVAE
jgi:hypothetical protein